MKSKYKNGFKPFTITIESEAEARILWHRLNISRYTSPEDYYISKNLNWTAVEFNTEARINDLWGSINKMYNPSGK